VGLGRKGIVFSLLAVALSSLFLMWFADYYEPSIDEMVPVFSSRVLILNNAVSDAFSYAEYAAKTSSYYALRGLYEEINTTGIFLSDFNTSFVVCAVNGTSSCSNTHNLSVLLDEYVLLVNNDMRIPLGMQLHSFEWVDERPFSLKVRLNVSVWIVDHYASWNLSGVIETWVGTTGIYDPAFYNISTTYGGIVGERQIRPAGTGISSWDENRFHQFYLLEQYNPFSSGPCLSHRFEGDWFEIGGVRCGIETIVHPNNYVELQNQSGHPDLFNLTMVDHRLLRDERFPCQGEDDRLVNVTSVGVILSREDAGRFEVGYVDVYC
jgi:hypothetical protein